MKELPMRSYECLRVIDHPFYEKCAVNKDGALFALRGEKFDLALTCDSEIFGLWRLGCVI
jgi:hypothetical protein